MIVHLVDGTYELFRHFYGLRRFNKGVDRPYGAVVGVLQTMLQMIENGDTYLGVATDHVIESFRNRLWADYKTGAGIEPALLAQFHALEEALAAMGVVVWPMMRSLRPRISRRRTKRSRKSPSGRLTRISGNACEIRAWCRSTAYAKRFAMRLGYAKNSASARSSFRTCSRSWAMRPTATPASLGSAPGPPPSF